MGEHGYTLGSASFTSKERVRAYCKDLLLRTAAGARLSGEDLARISDLVRMHHDAALKIGCGIAAIEVRPTPPYNSKAFHIVRQDGTYTDFSYNQCLEPRPVEHKFIDACRCAVRPHIERYRLYFFRLAKTPTCPLTGEPLTLENSHVDHCPPFTFERIVRAFLELYGFKADDPRLCKRGDNITEPLFADDVMRDRFVQFHNCFAQLRVVSGPANVTLVTQSVRLGQDRLVPDPIDRTN